MSGIMEHLLARRSIRQFTREPVAAADIRRLLEAAMAAPSASNRRPWAFVVVTAPDTLASLRRGLVLGRYEAPLTIVVCGNMRRAWLGPARDFWIQDCSAATQNILLAATGLGLGAVWIGVHPIAPFRWHVAHVLRLPRWLRPLAAVHVGHPSEAKAPRTQYAEASVHWQRYGGHALAPPAPQTEP